MLKSWAARRAAKVEARVWRGVRGQLRAGERPIEYLTCDMPGSWLKGYLFATSERLLSTLLLPDRSQRFLHALELDRIAAIVPADDDPRAFIVGYREEWAPEDVQAYSFVVARSAVPLIGFWFNALLPAWNASRGSSSTAEAG